MPIPIDAYAQMLANETMQIGRQQREDEFETYTVVAPPDAPPEEEVYQVAFTNVHMVPGDTSPRLRKARMPNLRVPLDIAEEVTARLADEIDGPLPRLHEDHMRAISQAAVAACEEVDEQQSSPLVQPFKTLAVMSIALNNDGHPVVFQHSSKNFGEIMARHFPDRWRMDPSGYEDIPDELLQTIYDRESEHKDVSPFDEWKQGVKEGVGDAVAGVTAEGGDLMTAQCMADMGYFLAGEEAMHPTIAKLFRE